MSILDDIERQQEQEQVKTEVRVEPQVIPDFEVGTSEVPVIPKPNLNPQHPLNRPEDIPSNPASEVLDIDPDDFYKYVQNNFERYMPNYEKGFVPQLQPSSEGYLLSWKYAPDAAESTLMAYHDKAKTTNEDDYRKKIDDMITDFVEDIDQVKLRRFVEVVDYDADACRGLIDRDSHFLSQVADIDVLDFNMKYFHLVEIKKLNKTMDLLLQLTIDTRTLVDSLLQLKMMP